MSSVLACSSHYHIYQKQFWDIFCNSDATVYQNVIHVCVECSKMKTCLFLSKDESLNFCEALQILSARGSQIF